MISVLTEYTAREAEFPRKSPAVGLFADQEIKLIKGPLFVNHPYRLEREICQLSESRRVESSWSLTKVYDEKTNELVAECILNHSLLKASYKDYEADAKALCKNWMLKASLTNAVCCNNTSAIDYCETSIGNELQRTKLVNQQLTANALSASRTL